MTLHTHKAPEVHITTNRLQICRSDAKSTTNIQVINSGARKLPLPELLVTVTNVKDVGFAGEGVALVAPGADVITTVVRSTTVEPDGAEAADEDTDAEDGGEGE